MCRYLLPFAAAVGFATLLCQHSVVASPPSKSSETSESQFSGRIELPSWGDNEYRECFDIRIWPKEIVLWLEQENIRDLIADPKTPEEERQALKMVLAQQNAWRST